MVGADPMACADRIDRADAMVALVGGADSTAGVDSIARSDAAVGEESAPMP